MDQELCARPEYSVLGCIRKHLTTKWKFVGYSLKLKHHVLEKIEQRQTKIEDQAFAMLVEWMQTDVEPCYCKLISALDEQGLSNIANDLKVIVKSGNPGLH